MPPPTLNCIGIFADVPCTGSQWSPFAPYIEKLYNDGVTAGCGGSNFCPGNNVTAWQIVVWMSKTPAVPGGVAWGSVYHPVPRGSIYTLRDEQNHVVTEMTGGSGSNADTLLVTSDNVFLGSLLVASKSSTAWTYMVSDHLGSPRQFWNASGTAGENHRYWPYGEDANTTLNQHVAFQGMERNDGLQVYFDHARSQQFNLGRFVTTEPVWLGCAAVPSTWNQYSYGGSNPEKYTDPDGENLLLAVGAVGGLYNGAADAFEYLGEHPDDWALGQVAARVGVGFVSGFLGTLAGEAAFFEGNPILGGAIASGVASAVDQGISHYAFGDEISPGAFAMDVATGAAASKLAYRIGIRPGRSPSLTKARKISDYLRMPKVRGKVIRSFGEGTLDLGIRFGPAGAAAGYRALQADYFRTQQWLLDMLLFKHPRYSIGIETRWRQYPN